MSTILNYSFTTTPNPLTLGLSDGIFQLIAANRTGETVTLQGITISINTGVDEQDLTNFPKQINPVAPAGWKMAKPNVSPGKYTFVFIPKLGTTTDVPAYGSLIFRLTDIIVSSKGVAEITVTEGTPNAPTKQLSVSKFPSGWGQISFTAAPLNLVNEGDVSLSWNGPVKAKYQIQYLDESTQQIVNIPAPGDPPLDHFGSYPGQDDPPLRIKTTTNFTMYVEAMILGQKYFTEITREVTVGEIPTVKSFNAKIVGTGMKSKLELSWECSDNAIYAMPSWQPELLSPSATAVIDLPFDKEYSIKAVAVNGIKSKPLTIDLNWGVIAELDFDDSSSNPWGIDLGPDQKQAYIADQGSNCIRKVDLTLFEQVEIINVSPNPRAVSVTPDGNYAFVGHYMGDDEVTVSVITLPELKVTKTFNLGSPYCDSIGITPDGQYALVVNQGDFESTLVIIEISSMTVANTIKLGNQVTASYITISPDGQRAYISEQNGGTITVFDIPEQKVLSNVPVDMLPIPLQVTPNNKYVIVPGALLGNVVKIDTETLKIAPPIIKIQDGFNSVGVTADSSTAILGGMLGHAYFIDIESFTQIETVTIKGYPYGMAVTNDDLALICNFNDGSIQVLGLDVVGTSNK